MTNERWLPGVPGDEITAIFNRAPGNEIATGKFDSPESSAALAANAFGFFLKRLHQLPPLWGCENVTWPAKFVALESTMRFPWRGGRHPILDVLIATASGLIGIESKRFEPFRAKPNPVFSDAYWRPVWGESMQGYESIRDILRDNPGHFCHLDAAQLVKHAFGMRTQVNREGSKFNGSTPILYYLYSEPDTWPKSGEPVDSADKDRHWQEIADFADTVAGDEVAFVSCSYRSLLNGWRQSGAAGIHDHANAVIQRFAP